MNAAQIIDAVPLFAIGASAVGLAGYGITALGEWTHNSRLSRLGTGVSSAALQISQAITQLNPGVDVNAYKDAKVAEWVGKLTARNSKAIAKTGMTAEVLAEKIDSAVHAIDVTSATSVVSSGQTLGAALAAKYAPEIEVVTSVAKTVAAAAAAPAKPAVALAPPVASAPGQIGPAPSGT